jgi:FkbM family methyltransferase
MNLRAAARDLWNRGSAYLTSADARSVQHEIWRLRKLPRYQAGVTGLLGRPLRYVDAASLLSAHYEIFGRQLYRFEASHSAPLIIDVGSNIGLSVIYFKRLYPAARVKAIEADPAIFRTLSENVETFELADVELIEAAATVADGPVEFHREGGDAGRLEPLMGAASNVVRGLRLRDLLAEETALLKLDIEGAEVDVLLDCSDRLRLIDHLFVEYHSFEERPQRLAELLAVLEENDFRIHVESVDQIASPFVHRELRSGFDLQLNIFATRRTSERESRISLPHPGASLSPRR